jgi:hypothetical protein
MSTLLPFFQWCDGTLVARTIRDSRLLFPVIECFHLFALAVLLGTVLILDLRLLGAGMRALPLSPLARSLAPLTFASLLVMLITGGLLFCSEAMKCYASPPFLIKMVALLLAIIFHWSVFQPAVRASREPAGPRRVAIAIVSMILWFGVAVAGRAIGFY